MDTSQVTVATMTWARSPKEEAALRRSLTALASSGLHVVVADAGTSTGFLQFLVSLPTFTVTVPADAGLVAQIAASLATASTRGTGAILYTEPDKQFFFERHLMEFLRAADVHRDAAVILAARSPESFQTFPPMQQYTEEVINRLCGEMIGVAADYSYGPFVMDSALVPLVAGLDARLGWGWRHFMFRSAHRLGRRVIAIAGHYPCPDEQRLEDEAERLHRIRQLGQNVLGLVD